MNEWRDQISINDATINTMFLCETPLHIILVSPHGQDPGDPSTQNGRNGNGTHSRSQRDHDLTQQQPVRDQQLQEVRSVLRSRVEMKHAKAGDVCGA